MENNKQEELQEEVNENASEEVEETIEEAIEEATEAKDSSEADEKDKKVEELTDTLQRLQAEYANYRRRTQQEKETIGIFANEKILNELIPVIDSMERALEACTDKEDTMFKGVELVYKQLKDMITKFGVEEIEAQDADFDPNLHLAVMQESVDGVEPNKVVMVLQKGYKLGNKVLRASMVKVSC